MVRLDWDYICVPTIAFILWGHLHSSPFGSLFFLLFSLSLFSLFPSLFCAFSLLMESFENFRSNFLLRFEAILALGSSRASSRTSLEASLDKLKVRQI